MFTPCPNKKTESKKRSLDKRSRDTGIDLRSQPFALGPEKKWYSVQVIDSITMIRINNLVFMIKTFLINFILLNATVHRPVKSTTHIVHKKYAL